MEEQDTCKLTPNRPAHQHHSLTSDTDKSPSSSTTLESSEPSLRFPCPQGNSHLAQWISDSNPDIMRMTTVPADDDSLGGSTYELITGTDDDSWSHDGRDQDLTSESVSSLDPHRPDDVNSLADEHMTDDESNLVHDADDTPVASRYTTAGFLIEGFPGQRLRPLDDGAETDSEDDGESRSSLEYAKESLKTPSIPTPEASHIYEHPTFAKLSAQKAKALAATDSETSLYGAARKFVADRIEAWFPVNFTYDEVRHVSMAALPWFVLFVGACLLPQVITTVRGPAQDVAPPTTTVYVTTTATHTTPLLLSATASPDRRLSRNPQDQVEIAPKNENTRSSDWIFGKKADVTFSTPSSTKLMAHIPPEIKDTWISKDCIEVVATREGRNIPMTVNNAAEGLMVKFPRAEAHGVVDVTFRASCKPALHRVLKVHFGKGILEEVYEMTKHIAHDLTEFVPAAAHEAERQLGKAKRSWGYVEDLVGTTALSVTDTMSQGLSTWISSSRQSLMKAETGMTKAATGLSTYVAAIRHEATDYCTELSDARLRAQYGLSLELLHAQVSAKVWWLKVTGREQQRVDYQRKAKDFLSAKQAAAREAIARKVDSHEAKSSKPSGSWNVGGWKSATGKNILSR